MYRRNEAAVLKVRDLRADGVNVRQITRTLKREGLLKSNGTPYSLSWVRWAAHGFPKVTPPNQLELPVKPNDSTSTSGAQTQSPEHYVIRLLVELRSKTKAQEFLKKALAILDEIRE